MSRLSISLLALLFVTLLSACSNSANDPVSPSDSNPLISQESLSGELSSDSRTFLGSWTANFDTEKMTAELIPSRDLLAHYNVKNYLPAPTIVINSYNPTTNIVDVDVTIKNSFTVNAFDLRFIVYTDGAGHKLLNDDNWTSLYDISGGLPINPFKAYNKLGPQRVFLAQNSYTENLQIFLPAGNPNVKFAIDASFPGNCEEPYEIKNFSHGSITDNVGSATQIEVTVWDWQNNVSAVNLYASAITGTTLLPLSKIGGYVWGTTLVNNTGAAPGTYLAYIIADSPGAGNVSLYDEVTITVSQSSGTPSDPIVVGNAPGVCRGVAYENDHVYSADEVSGLVVIDVSNRALPQIKGSVATGGTPNDVDCKSGYAYLTDSTTGFFVIDARTPTAPTIVDTEVVDEAWRVKVRGDYLYMTWYGFAIADISNPADAVFISDMYAYGIANDIALNGDYAYVSTIMAGMDVIDISNVYSPYTLASISGIRNAGGIGTNGEYAYMMDDGTSGEFRVMDVTTPSNPHVERSIIIGGGEAMEVVGEYAYCAMLSGGMTVVDLSDKLYPEILAVVDTPGVSTDIVVSDNYAFLADGGAGMQVIKLW